MERNTIVGANIRRFRERIGLTQEALAQYLNISREEVSYYETGKRQLPTRLVSEAAKLFGVDPYALFEDNPEIAAAGTALAFRAEELSPEDLRQIADFRKIVLNYLKMKALADESPGT